jgi:hypothetical protein
MFNILDMISGWKIDVIFKKPSVHHQRAFQRRTSAEIESGPLVAATAEDTIVSKLERAKMGESSRQIEDVAGILKARLALLDRAYIEKWVGELGLTFAVGPRPHSCRPRIATPSAIYTLRFPFPVLEDPHGLIRSKLRQRQSATFSGRTQRPAPHSQREHRART